MKTKILILLICLFPVHLFAIPCAPTLSSISSGGGGGGVGLGDDNAWIGSNDFSGSSPFIINWSTSGLPSSNGQIFFRTGGFPTIDQPVFLLYGDDAVRYVIPTNGLPAVASIQRYDPDTDLVTWEPESKTKQAIISIQKASTLAADNMFLMNIDATKYPNGITLTNIQIQITGTLPTTNFRFMVEEWSASATTTEMAFQNNTLTSELALGSTNYENNSSVFTDASIDAGDILRGNINDTDYGAEAMDFELTAIIQFKVN